MDFKKNEIIFGSSTVTCEAAWYSGKSQSSGASINSDSSPSEIYGTLTSINQSGSLNPSKFNQNNLNYSVLAYLYQLNSKKESIVVAIDGLVGFLKARK